MDIQPIYQNNLGIAFRWKSPAVNDITKIQIVFRDTGLLIDKAELKQFLRNIRYTKESGTLCADCINHASCKVLLVQSPSPKITFAMNVEELKALTNLVERTLFYLSLEDLIQHALGD